MHESKLNPKSEEFKQNQLAMQQLVDQLNERLAKVSAGGGERGARKMREQGKLLPRERLELLLDPGTPFLELSPLAAWEMYGVPDKFQTDVPLNTSVSSEYLSESAVKAGSSPHTSSPSTSSARNGGPGVSLIWACDAHRPCVLGSAPKPVPSS